MLGTRVQIVHRPNLSDADPTKVPAKPGYTIVDPPMIYLEKCGELWMERQEARQKILGTRYTLQTLPSGYILYERVRPSNANHTDRFLYGHPSGKYFNSPNDFYPHFEYLQLNDGVNIGCGCRVCGGRGTSNSTPASVASSLLPTQFVKKKPGRPPKDPSKLSSLPVASTSVSAGTTPPLLNNAPSSRKQEKNFDEEGTPDALANLIERSQVEDKIDESLEEPRSMDYVATHEGLEDWIDTVHKQAAWIPRCGELVLFVRELSEGCGLLTDSKFSTVKVFDTKQKKFFGCPQLEAGVIGQVPQSSKPFEIDEIMRPIENQTNITYSGFRVEPLPEPGQGDKSRTTRHKYVPLHLLRPFHLWFETLKGIQNQHETIRNAINVASTLALVGKYRFKSDRQKGVTVFCKGAYVGSDYIACGDTVRILSEHQQPPAMGFLQVKAIQLRLTHLQTIDDRSGQEKPFESSVVFRGKAFTTDRAKAINTDQPVEAQDLPKVLNTYDQDSFYWLHDPNMQYQVAFNRTGGRVPEANAMRLWIPRFDEAAGSLLEVGVKHLVQARGQSVSFNEHRRSSPDEQWYWADTRLEALDVRSLNGVDAAPYDSLRDDRLEASQKAARVHAKSTAPKGALVGRPRKADVGQAMGMQRTTSTSHVGSGQEEEGGDGQLPERSNDENDEHYIDQRPSHGNSDQSRKRSASQSMHDSETASPLVKPGSEDNEDDEIGDAPSMLKAFQTHLKKTKTAEQ